MLHQQENSPNMPSMPHETQEEAQESGVTLLRFPAEGEPCDCECEAAKIVVMAENTNGILELPMEIAEFDEMAVLDGKLEMRVCEVDDSDDSMWKSAETPARTPT